MRAQLRKLDMIVGRHRQNARYVRERIQKLPGIKLRRSNDQEGELGWTVDMLLPDMEDARPIRGGDESGEGADGAAQRGVPAS